MELENILIEIVNDSQDVTFNIQKGIENLRELFSKVALLEQKDRCNLILLRQFVKLLNILLIERNEHRVHFVVEFIIKFLVQFNQNENEEFIQYELINYLINVNSLNIKQIHKINASITIFLKEFKSKFRYSASENLSNILQNVKFNGSRRKA